MCGRFTLRTPAAQIAKYFNVSAPQEWQLALRFNIAPTQQVAAIRQSEEKSRELVPLRWGLVPSWAKDLKIGNSLINARGESVAEKPSFRAAFKRRRCLIAADGYYEWKKLDAKTKQPYYIRREDEKPFAFAGLWERWDKDPEPIESCTIITTDANEVTRDIHDRMPVILSPDNFDIWLDSEFQGYDFLKSLLVPYAGNELTAYPVSRVVNSPKNDGPDCIVPHSS